jgi:hypothetical protein
LLNSQETPAGCEPAAFRLSVICEGRLRSCWDLRTRPGKCRRALSHVAHRRGRWTAFVSGQLRRPRKMVSWPLGASGRGEVRAAALQAKTPPDGGYHRAGFLGAIVRRLGAALSGRYQRGLRFAWVFRGNSESVSGMHSSPCEGQANAGASGRGEVRTAFNVSEPVRRCP